ncbi:MAG: TRAP transporter large permease [Sphaerochaeta associata]|uniref:TRAP transporter large permease n=1 Tax=Sphaerochaeta associata TaxID=1129264 RepID=UPI002B209737|nr:TRAP transporter large permease [Sphaerochaeta associata]MEA5030226.1 TRAP transporter large permease [Sphaerochaeta associata]MEA5107831.1 TRAP transporter large permease [Sphaerochaeta associata]
MSGSLVIILFLFLLATGLPIAVSMGIPSALYLMMSNIPPSQLIQRMVTSLNSFPMLAVPLFILAAGMMNSSGITERLFEFAKLLVGRMKGGLAQVNIVASLIFSGISGAALADVGGLGNIEIEAMDKQNYPRTHSAAITAASAVIGPIFPPSIPLIIYGAAAETSSMRLLIAGVLPALVIAMALMIQVAFFARKFNYPRGVDRKFSFSEIKAITKRGLPSMLMPVIMMGGMLSGWFSPTEVAAIAVAYAIVLSLAYKELTLATFIKTCIETLRSTASVLFIVASAAIFAWVLTVEQMPQQVSALMLSISDNPIILLMLANVVLLVAGMFLESTAAIMILTPILLPPLVAAGVDPVHFGLVMVFNLMIGMITPPVGMSVYMLSPIVGLPVGKVFKAVLPYLASLLVALVVLTYVPQISLWLPNLVFASR